MCSDLLNLFLLLHYVAILLHVIVYCEYFVAVSLYVIVLNEYCVADRMQEDEMKKIMEQRRRDKEEEKRAKLVVTAFMIKKVPPYTICILVF